MKEIKIKIYLSVFFILSHFGIVLYLVYLRYYLDYIQQRDFEAAASIIFPVFATISTIIIKYIIENKNRSLVKSRKVNNLFVFISFLLPFLFVLSLVIVIYLQRVKPNPNFVPILGILESLFGVYIGYIIKSLFELKDPNRNFNLDFVNNDVKNPDNIKDDN